MSYKQQVIDTLTQKYIDAFVRDDDERIFAILDLADRIPELAESIWDAHVRMVIIEDLERLWSR
jgi:hypothetical protein